MKRLTEKNNSRTGYFYPVCLKKCDGMGATSKCASCEFEMQIGEKLADMRILD